MRELKIHLLFCIIVSGLFSDVHGQQLAQAKNIYFSVQENQAIIHFDIKTRDPHTLHLVDLNPSLLFSGDPREAFHHGKVKTIASEKRAHN